MLGSEPIQANLKEDNPVCHGTQRNSSPAWLQPTLNQHLALAAVTVVQQWCVFTYAGLLLRICAGQESGQCSKSIFSPCPTDVDPRGSRTWTPLGLTELNNRLEQAAMDELQLNADRQAAGTARGFGDPGN